MILVGGGGGDMDWEKTRTVRIQSQEPILLLLVCHNVDDRCCPFRLVHLLQFLKQDLNFLTIGCALGDQVEALGKCCNQFRTTISLNVLYYSCQ